MGCERSLFSKSSQLNPFYDILLLFIMELVSYEALFTLYLLCALSVWLCTDKAAGTRKISVRNTPDADA